MNVTPLRAFQAHPTYTKDFILSRLEAHRAADEIIQGIGWANGKGCAVGCTLHEYEHERYPELLGVDLELAHLEDRIFEGLPNELAKDLNREVGKLTSTIVSAHVFENDFKYLRGLFSTSLGNAYTPIP
jgi:hypothetical protein